MFKVSRGGQADMKGVREGDAITAISRQPIHQRFGEWSRVTALIAAAQRPFTMEFTRPRPGTPDGAAGGAAAAAGSTDDNRRWVWRFRERFCSKPLGVRLKVGTRTLL